jgi:hypothetical protein
MASMCEMSRLTDLPTPGVGCGSAVCSREQRICSLRSDRSPTWRGASLKRIVPRLFARPTGNPGSVYTNCETAMDGAAVRATTRISWPEASKYRSRHRSFINRDRAVPVMPNLSPIVALDRGCA